MNVKAVALVKQDKQLEDICMRIQSRTECLKKQVENLREKIEALAKDAHEQNEPEWQALRDRLNELGLIDEYDEQTHALSFNMERNVIEMLEKGTGNPIAEIMRGLFS